MTHLTLYYTTINTINHLNELNQMKFMNKNDFTYMNPYALGIKTM